MSSGVVIIYSFLNYLIKLSRIEEIAQDIKDQNLKNNFPHQNIQPLLSKNIKN